MNAQGDLFDPAPAECPGLTAAHLQWAGKARKMADVFAARGWPVLAKHQRVIEADHLAQAECLAMLADLYELARIS